MIAPPLTFSLVLSQAKKFVFLWQTTAITELQSSPVTSCLPFSCFHKAPHQRSVGGTAKLKDSQYIIYGTSTARN